MANGQIKAVGTSDKGTRIGCMKQFGVFRQWRVEGFMAVMVQRLVVVLVLFVGLVCRWVDVETNQTTAESRFTCSSFWAKALGYIG